jgi:PhnB protein
MPKRSLNPGKNGPTKAEQLNRAVDAMLARSDGKIPGIDASVEPLVRVAADLRLLPHENFKARLKSELQGRKNMSTVAEPVAAVRAVATPRLIFKDAGKAIEFYKQAFGAEEKMRFEVRGGIPHAELAIGESEILLSDEWPDGGRFSAETLGGSPVQLSLAVADVDSFAERAVAAGLKTAAPIRDQFYGRREGSFVDPFGYTWNISTVKEEMSIDEMHRRMPTMERSASRESRPGTGGPAVNPVRKGFLTVTPYLVAQDAESVIEFLKKTFGAEEMFRDVGSAGGYHCELRIEDSMLMIGGGGTGLAWKGDAVPGAFHIYVRDCDAAYQLALNSGAKPLQEPADQPWGERTANVVDGAGNRWYIATFKGEGNEYKSEGAPTVQPFLHPLRAEPVIDFLKRAFGAVEMGRFTTPDGVIPHTTLKIGTASLEMGEADGAYQPMKSMFYLYVPQVDAVYRRAITAGATSIHEPADQPYGDRVGAVKDVFGNTWYIGTHIKDMAP